MSDRHLARLVVPVALAYTALAVGALLLSWPTGHLADVLEQLPGVTAFAVLGSVLASRRPRNLIGWTFLSTSIALMASDVSAGVAEYGLVTAPGSIPFAPVVAWINLWFGDATQLTSYFTILLFPTGSLPSRRWRPVALGVSVISLALTAIIALGYPTLPDAAIPNPFLVPALIPIASAVSPSLFILLLVPPVASLVARYRSGSAIEREQLKWVVLSGVLLVGLVAAVVVPPVIGAATFFSWLVMPTGIAIAILRYRLLDIDHLINRTLVYAATSGVIALLFYIAIVALQPFVRSLTSGTELAIAASTLVAFALFQPIRRRVQDAVDRRFDRSRYDAAKTLDAFSEDLRDEVDLDDLKADLIGAVRRTMSPTHASIWLREGRR